jgi:hypothetical protein
MDIQLCPRQTPGSAVHHTSAGWRLEIPAGPARTYRLAQLDDYGNTARKLFSYSPHWTLLFRARVSKVDLPGTWGFGLWNDPFGFSLGFRGGKRGQLPALPQTAWFMHASQPNWLSLQGNSERVPANGFFAGTFRSLRIPSILFAPGALAISLCAIRPFSRLFRRLASRFIHQEGARVDLDVTKWHEYSIQWLRENCTFSLDGKALLHTTTSPQPPLGLVLWIDNQYAAWTPQGKLGYGTLENPDAWLEVEGLEISRE